MLERRILAWWTRRRYPAFYSYASPAPDGFSTASIRPAHAFWNRISANTICPTRPYALPQTQMRHSWNFRPAPTRPQPSGELGPRCAGMPPWRARVPRKVCGGLSERAKVQAEELVLVGPGAGRVSSRGVRPRLELRAPNICAIPCGGAPPCRTKGRPSTCTVWRSTLTICISTALGLVINGVMGEAIEVDVAVEPRLMRRAGRGRGQR